MNYCNHFKIMENFFLPRQKQQRKTKILTKNDIIYGKKERIMRHVVERF